MKRRTFVLGAGAVSLGLAGCTGNDDNGEVEPANGDENGDENGADAEGSTDPADWDDVGEIRLTGEQTGWTGIEPAAIEDVENPTLVLFEGEEYELTWENGDGLMHNIEFRDDGGEVIEGTELTDDAEQSITFEATADMTTYICVAHEAQQVGDVQIE